MAIPTSYGQELKVSNTQDNKLTWKTKIKEEVIFNAIFDLKGNVLECDHPEMAERLSNIFNGILKLSNTNKIEASFFEATMDFPMEWGLGSSSTLINNLSMHYKIDPFQLLEETFGGSGYDIACAGSNQPIIYSIQNKVPKWDSIEFNPVFSDKLFFVYLNRKMNSRTAIRLMKNKEEISLKTQIDQVSEISLRLPLVTDIIEFGELLDEHESILSNFLGIKTIKEELFNDYPGSIKSLGAWGGDFVLVVGESDEMNYFRNRGYETIIPYSEMVLNEDSNYE